MHGVSVGRNKTLFLSSFVNFWAFQGDFWADLTILR